MKRVLFTHTLWLLVALASFAGGYYGFPAQSELLESAGAALRAGKARDGAGKRFELGALRAGGERIAQDGGTLSERAIRSLGETFRTSASPIERRLAFSQLLQGLTAENALLVREQIAHRDHHSAEFREFHYAWGAVGGAAAALFGIGTEEDDMAPALAGWASADPSAALAWFEALDMKEDARFDPLIRDRKLNPAGLRDHLMRGLVQGLADTDPQAASTFLHTLAESGNKAAPGMMHTVAEAVMRTKRPSEAAVWAEALPAGPARNVALNRVADRFVDEDPDAAAAWAAQYAEEPKSVGIIAEVGANWSHRDPAAALQWLTDLPAGHGQNAGLHRALRDWTHRDPTAASEYLAALPTSPARDAAITGFSSRLAWEDPQAAIAWAETIASDGQRNKTMIAVGRAWARKDPTALAHWVASAGLPENIQQSILNPPRDKSRR